MKKYLALLRAVNTLGKNKISMSMLKQSLEQIGYLEVKTYINSGNVVFKSEGTKEQITKAIQEKIQQVFNLNISIVVMTLDELSDILNHAPSWWGIVNKEVYDNVMFAISPMTADKLLESLGNVPEEYEKVAVYKNVIFCSAKLKHYIKTRCSIIAKSTVNETATIRNANSINKLLTI